MRAQSTLSNPFMSKQSLLQRGKARDEDTNSLKGTLQILEKRQGAARQQYLIWKKQLERSFFPTSGAGARLESHSPRDWRLCRVHAGGDGSCAPRFNGTGECSGDKEVPGTKCSVLRSGSHLDEQQELSWLTSSDI